MIKMLLIIRSFFGWINIKNDERVQNFVVIFFVGDQRCESALILNQPMSLPKSAGISCIHNGNYKPITQNLKDIAIELADVHIY